MADPVLVRKRSFYSRHLTALTLVGLAGGLAFGLLHRFVHAPVLHTFASGVVPLGTMWMRALQMTIVPLVIVQLIGSVAGVKDIRTVGRMGGLSVLIFVLFLFGGGLSSALLLSRVVPWIPVHSGTFTMATEAAAPPGPVSIAQWLIAIVPSNPVKAAADGALLPLMVFIVLLALAMTRVTAEHRQILTQFFAALQEAVHVLVRWILMLMPVGVFALALPVAMRNWNVALEALGWCLAIEIALLAGFTLLMYPLARAFGRTGLGQFARATWPAQAVAIGTCSSLASLPALLEGAARWLTLPDEIPSFVLPLSVTIFRPNRMVTSAAKLFFIAHFYGIPLQPLTILFFLAGIFLTSFGTPGLPGPGTHLSLPVYLAVGLPMEGILLFSSVDSITDIFRTLFNVTSYVTTLTIVGRFSNAAVTQRTLEAESAT